jgi:hypothetical protein
MCCAGSGHGRCCPRWRLAQKVVDNLGGGAKSSRFYAAIICPYQSLSLCTSRIDYFSGLLPGPQFVYRHCWSKFTPCSASCQSLSVCMAIFR